MRKAYLFLAFMAVLLMFAGCGDKETNDPVPVTGITLNKTFLALQVNAEEQLKATILPAKASNKKVDWESSDQEKVFVDQTGAVSALAAGDATITATTKDGGFKATCFVRVTTTAPVPVESVAISGGSRMAVGDTLNLTATITPSTATIRNVTWSSSKDSVATVSATGTNGQTGMVTAVSAGTVTITVHAADNKTATHDIIITAETVVVTGVSLNKASAELTAGETLELTATVAPATATHPAVSWSSSNPSIASVSGGLVTAVANGTATITVTTADGDHTATCTVTVTGGEAPRNYTEIEGQTLVHYTPVLAGVNHFGGNQGTDNADGSYTFDGTAGSWSGGGAQYDFPTPGAGAAWLLSDYDLVEMQLSVTAGSVAVGIKKSGGNSDLRPYPSATNFVTLNSATGNGKVTYTFVMGEAGAGIGFQRNNSGPATVTIEKAVFSKGTIHTIKFEGGEYTAMPAIADIKIPNGRTVNFYGSYDLTAIEPEREGYTFTGWQIKNGGAFVETTPITGDITLVAQWDAGAPEQPDMTLSLDPDTWEQDIPTNLGNNGAWPTDYAVASYANGKLTLEFSGVTRQKGVIPLSNAQTNWLVRTDEAGVTYRINGAAYKEDGTTRFNASDETIASNMARFRVHLANPGGDGVSPGTDNLSGGVGDGQSVNIDNLVFYVAFANRDRANLSFLVIQAMYDDGEGQAGGSVNLNEKVKFIIESIVIDVGNTTQ